MCYYLLQGNYSSEFLVCNIHWKVGVSFLRFSPIGKGFCRHYPAKDPDSAVYFSLYWLDAKRIFSKQHQALGKISLIWKNVLLFTLHCDAELIPSVIDKEEH